VCFLADRAPACSIMIGYVAWYCHHRCWHLPWLSTYSPQPSSRRSKNEFCTKQSPWSFTKNL